MHLGRFHAVIYKLCAHFENLKILEELDKTANSMRLYTTSKSPEHLEAFKNHYATIVKATEMDPQLRQPYAKQTIEEIGLTQYIGEDLAKTVEEIISKNSFDQHGIVNEITSLREELAEKISNLNSIDSAFTTLHVEYVAVANGESEVGILIPRTITGEKIEDLTKELQQINKIFRAINEITGNNEYSPSIRTISTSWWQVFLEVDHTQVAAWIFAIERIVALFKSNLEIKALQKQLEEKSISKKITAALEKEVTEKINNGIASISNELRKKYASSSDSNRLNELEVQLKQGLTYLAKRINQGAEVEINTALPRKPAPPAENSSAEILLAYENSINEYEKLISELSSLQSKGYAASQSILQIEKDSPLGISYEEDNDTQEN